MAITIAEEPQIRSMAIGISREMYHKLFEQGKIPEKTELLEGVIISKMPKSPLHTEFLKRLMNIFGMKLVGEYEIRKEEPLIILESEPEPDLAIVDTRDYSEEHPNYAHLVIEIAINSLGLDRKKAEIYAQGKIPEYWLFNLKDNVLEIYLEPENGIYKTNKILRPGQIAYPDFAKELEIDLAGIWIYSK